MDGNVKIKMLDETLNIMKQGWYEKDGKRIELKLSQAEMKDAQVFLEEDVEKFCNDPEFQPPFAPKGTYCIHGYKRRDAFYMARTRAEEGGEKILVLNFATPTFPGGDVRKGIDAQEADLCRSSSLLLSLESENAKKFYDHHNKVQNRFWTDSMILTPKVEIIRDQNGDLLDETLVVSVLSCTAPDIKGTGINRTVDSYCDLLYKRIRSIIWFAAYHGYKNLILGAWGCGEFGNNANYVSDLFARALLSRYNGRCEHDLFEHIDFAVFDNTEERYNLIHFKRNFIEPIFYDID